MFGLGFGEIILLAMIALVVIGPKQLPQVARVLGKFVGEFRRTIGDFNSEIHRATQVVRQEDSKHKQQIRESLDNITKEKKPTTALPPVIDEKNDV